MEVTEDMGQAVSQMKLTLPKKIFEVCHLMKRETEAEFFTVDAAGVFTNEIRIVRVDDDNVSISLTVDNLIFEANHLCFRVDKVEAKDENAVQEILEQPAAAVVSSAGRREAYNIGGSTAGEVLLDLHTEMQSGSMQKASITKSTATTTEFNAQEEEDDDDYTKIIGQDSERNTLGSKQVQSGIGLKTDAVEEINDGLSIGEEAMDEDDVDAPSFFSASNDMSLVGDGLDGSLKSPTFNAQAKMAEEVHVVVEKHEQPTLAKSLKKFQNADNEQSDKEGKPPASKGKKRPHYKREANIQCKLCHNMYKDELSLIAHVQKLHPTCDGTRQYIAELREQAKVECKICGKVLGNKRNEVSSHMMRVHGKDDDFVSRCEECGAEFRRTFLLKEHIRRQHPKHERVLCHLCPASFKLKEYLTEHIKYTHNKQFKWQCDVCGKMTSSPKNLRRHKKLHSGISFQCPVCDKLFSEAGNMKRHVDYVHNAQALNKFRCSHCHKDFSSKNNLIQHLNLVHAKTTPFYCDICKKYFARKKMLIEHAAVEHPGVPILSTTKSHNMNTATQTSALPCINTGTGEVLAGEQQEYTALAAVGGTDNQSTIILQGVDGTEHVIMTSQGLEGQSIPRLQQGMDMRAGEEELTQPSHNINMISAGGISDSGLTSLAQHALAAFEAGGGLEGDFAEEQYLSVIGDDGHEIRVQIVRKDPSEVQSESQLENIYVQAVAEEAAISLTEPEGQLHIVQDAANEAATSDSATHEAAQPSNRTQVSTAS